MSVTTVQRNEIVQVEEVFGSPLDYFNLMKPRVMSLVVFTAFVGYYIAPPIEGHNIHPFLACIGIFAIALGAGASGVLNQWYDRDIDKVMVRTKDRPIPLGKILPSEAFSFGIISSIISIMILGLAINWLAASLLAFTIFFYAVVYTIWLKRYTVQNIVIGGAAGAFPPVIGQVCATGHIGLESIILFMIIFIWTPPHFWALAIIKKDDYEAAKIPMLPIISGDKVTRKNILIYSCLLIPFSYMPWVLNYAGIFYLIITSLFGLEFLRKAILLYAKKEGSEKSLFLYSIFYLSFIFVSLCIDKFILNNY
ncbi:heme o synthase [Alphaproteobacteria bacterium]|nr:heme o synthase [Alphaproteobacteria bacterium]